MSKWFARSAICRIKLLGEMVVGNSTEKILLSNETQFFISVLEGTTYICVSQAPQRKYVETNKIGLQFRGQAKTANLRNGTKPPISKMRQAADFKMGQNGRFCKRERIAIKIVSLIKASWPIDN